MSKVTKGRRAYGDDLALEAFSERKKAKVGSARRKAVIMQLQTG